MTPREYRDYMVGKPYLQGSDSLEEGGIDCFGIIKDYFSEVRGIDIPSPSDRVDINTAGGEEISTERWMESSKEGADIFACFNKDDTMTHCGLVVHQRALHAVGTDDTGQVMDWPLRQLERVYKHRVKYYRYAKG